MKDLLKKYYGLSDEIKGDLQALYIYHKLLTNISNSEGRNVYSLNFDEIQMLMEIVQKCMLTTDLSIDYIVTNISETLNGQDIEIKDLYKLTIDELLEVVFPYENEENDIDDDENNQYDNNDEIPDCANNQEIIAEFFYKGYYLVFCENRDKYLIILNKDEDSDVIILNSIDEIFNGTLERKLKELKIYE